MFRISKASGLNLKLVVFKELQVTTEQVASTTVVLSQNKEHN